MEQQETLQEMVRKLRELNDAGDLDAAEVQLAEISAEKGPAIIPLLLTIRPYVDASHLDEMMEILEVVERFPREVYVPALATIMDDLCRTSPEILGRTLSHLFEDEMDTSRLAGYVGDGIKNVDGCAGRLVNSLISRYSDDETIVKNARQFLESLPN